MLDLASPAARQYLAARLDIDPSQIRLTELGGGVSNTVLLLETPSLRCVVKQALGKLRVEQEWFCARERIFRECDAIRQTAAILPPGAVPRILWEDRDNFLYAMSAAPANAVSWKEQLLAGEHNPATAAAAGEILAALIRGSSSAEDSAAENGWRQTFGDLAVFEDLRLDPYYRSTALRHPDLKQSFDSLIEECRQRSVSLVHGDFSPKNLLIANENVILIDFEVIHFGNPAFDAAFLTNHLMLKAFYRHSLAPSYRNLAAQFWNALRGLPAAFNWLEAASVRHLGGLMLARVDGKSPAEYIRDESTKNRIRDAARRILLQPPPSIDAAFEEACR